MGLERVKIDIVEKARHQASLTLIDAKKKAKEILAEAERRVAEAKEISDASTRRAIDDLGREETAKAELEGKKELLTARCEIIDAAFMSAKEDILSSKKTAAIIGSLLRQAQKDLDIAHLYCRPEDVPLVKGFKAKEMNISGGIIAENKDQTVRIDLSYDTLFSLLREQHLDEVARHLFG